MRVTTRFLSFRGLRAVALLLTTQLLPADTIILKDGTRYEGRVLREEGDSYLLEIQVTSSIRDERKVAKADVKAIEKVDPAKAAYAAIAGLDETPDLLPEDAYEPRIRKLVAFLKQHPTSPHNGAVRDMLAELEAEHKAVAAGSIKLDGRLISPAERHADALGIDARIAYRQMLDAASSGRLLDALRAFERLEARFPGSKAHLDALELVGKVLASFRNEILGASSSLERRLKEREVGLERMPAADRARALRLLKEEEAAYQKKRIEERESGTNWLSVSYYDERSLDETLRRIDSEINRLQRFSTERLKPTDEVYRDAWRDLEGADKDGQKRILSEARNAKLPQEYIDLLEQRAESAGAADPSGDQ